MPSRAIAEVTLIVGEPIVVECRSPGTKYSVVFEDDGQTGYFYGLDMELIDQPIVDALHINNVSNVTDGDIPSTLQIVWSDDGLKSALVINNHPHAIFDFESKRGYCRTNFPGPDKRWTSFDHPWDDSAMDLFN
jgi:hypothetical protein